MGFVSFVVFVRKLLCKKASLNGRDIAFSSRVLTKLTKDTKGTKNFLLLGEVNMIGDAPYDISQEATTLS